MGLQTEQRTPRIVKGAIGSTGVGPCHLNVEEFRDACDDHLDQVRRQARELISAAAAEAEAIRTQAFESGQAEGLAAGRRTAEDEIRRRIDQAANERVRQQTEALSPVLNRIVEQLEHQLAGWKARWERDAVELAVGIAEKIIHRTVAVDRTAAPAAIAELLRTVAGVPRLRLRIHPRDADAIALLPIAVRESIDKVGIETIVPDESITSGGCVIETQRGRIDAQIETQLRRVAIELMGSDDDSLAEDRA